MNTSKSRTIYLFLWVCLISQTLLFGKTSDTIPIASHNKRIVLDQKKERITIPLKMSASNLPLHGEYQIWFEGVKVKTAPDGIYTVFLSTKEGSGSALPNEPVGILDLYTFTEKKEKGTIIMSVNELLPRLMNRKKGRTKKVFVTILFEGNLLPDGSKSAHGGKLIFDAVRLMKL